VLELNLQAREQAIQTAFKLVGYRQRAAKRKGFSNNPQVIAEQLAFARTGIQ
jgi:hypothetical protein